MAVSPRVKKWLGLALSLVIGAVCLVLAFRGVASTSETTGIPWQQILDVIRDTTWWGYGGFLGLLLVQIWMRTHRWRIQVRGLTGRMPAPRESFAINGVSFAAVFLIPFRLGEFVRPNMSAARGIMGFEAGLAASALERVLDGIVTTGCFGVVLLLMRDRDVPAYVTFGGWVALAVFGGALAFFIVAFRWRAWTTSVVERVLGLAHGGVAKKVGAMLRGFLDGLACFKAPRDLFGYLFLTVAYWFLNGASMYVLMLGMHIDVEPMAAFFTLCFLIIGVMIPAPPGNVGNFHAFARAGLAVFAVSPPFAVAYAIVLHALNVLGIAAFAAVFFASGDVTFGAVKDATKKS
jgi:uncharacterized protein (TIRG00374 family)